MEIVEVRPKKDHYP